MTKKHAFPQHGTWAEYVKRNCRCDQCKEAARLYNQIRKNKNPDLVKRKSVYSRKWAAANPQKRRFVERQWREKNPMRHREGAKRRSERFRLKMYALTAEQHASMLKLQGGVCAICKSLDKRALSVDHDHSTGLIRGLLCRKCNMGLGCFADNPTTIELAARYLHRITEAPTV